MDEFASGFLAGQDSNGNNGNGFWGGDGIWAILLFAMIFGWGNGGNGGNNNSAPIVVSAPSCASTTSSVQEAIRAAVDQQTLISKLDQQTYGLADSTYALNNTITNGFHGVDNAVCNLGYNVQSGFNTLAHQLSDCCCTTQRAIDGVNYNMATQFCALGNTVQTSTRDILDNQNANTRAILDYLTNDKIDSLRAENQALRFSASQDRQNALLTTAMTAQTNQIIDRVAPYPVPSFQVNPPFYYGGNGCGCNSCC